jgi:adenine deaminase
MYLKTENYSVTGNLVDIHKGKIYPAKISIVNNKIEKIEELSSEDLNTAPERNYILPGLVDAHVHIESSMLIPTEFARMAVVHGTVATVSDPHEIANVLGVDGVYYMINNGKRSPFKFNFGAPSCVPATSFETAGAIIDAKAIRELLGSEDIGYLAEMMNFPGVLYDDEEVLEKIKAAKEIGKPVDGHAPGLRGDQAAKYAAAGITTDHECFTLEEALDKIECGMQIIIREGSAAKNFEALWPLLNSHPEKVMFCSDDKHPNDLELGHINQLLARAVAKGIDAITAIRAATLNPVKHYRMPVGLLRENDAADFILVKDLNEFEVVETYIDGKCVAKHGKTKLESVKEDSPNNFNCDEITTDQLRIKIEGPQVKCIVVEDGQLITGEQLIKHDQTDELVSDTSKDMLKMVVLNRYSKGQKPAMAMVHNFGLKSGALASTVAHDSHNIIAIGCNDEAIAKAINLLVASKGGISLVSDTNTEVLPLPVAGLMSVEDGWKVAQAYDAMDKESSVLGSPLSSPYMTLSFLALLVIPALKLSDHGLFDGQKFEFTSLFPSN